MENITQDFLVNLFKTQKVELEEMIAKGIRKEVEEATKPMKDIQDKMVKEQTEMAKKVEELTKKVEEIDKGRQNRSFANVLNRNRGDQVLTGANLQEQEVGAGMNANVAGGRMEEQEKGARGVREVGMGKEEQTKKICEKARRTIGFNRIGEDDILRMFGEAVPWGGAKTREQARKLAIQEFMACELKITKLDQEHMEIEDIFERKSEHLDTLYVRFKYRSSLSRIFEKVKFLTNGRSNLVTYIPREFQERFRALNEVLKSVRVEGEGWRTRVKMGQDDLIISKKTKQKGAVYQDLEFDMSNLPPVCLTRPQTQVTDSPPPGRPGHGEEEVRRKRRRSGLSSTGVTPQNKSKRNDNKSESEDHEDAQEEEEESESEEEVVKEATLPSKVTNRRKAEVYCGPATISPAKEGEGLLARPSVGVVSVEESIVKNVRTKKTKKIAV